MAGFFRRRAIKAKNTLSDWMSIGIIVGVFDLLKDIVTTVFFPGKRKKVEPETYEQVVRRMKLTEADLADRKKMFLTQTILYFVIGLAVLGYTVWLLLQGYYGGMFLALLVAALSFSYAFRSHFWLFQMKQKRLGCTFKEYWDSLLKSGVQ
jgi:intracellular multiplication protein IcmV